MEGGTFHNPQLAGLLRAKAVESRLHMDFPGRIDPADWVVQRRMQQELIGNRGMPYYAILDPENNEFLYKLYISGGDYGLLLDRFTKIFEELPDKPAKSEQDKPAKHG